jgi:hypothetical protein
MHINPTVPRTFVSDGQCIKTCRFFFIHYGFATKVDGALAFEDESCLEPFDQPRGSTMRKGACCFQLNKSYYSKV